MKKHILSIASLLAIISLNSCLQQETTINLKKDGSGTLVEETRMSAMLLGMTSLASLDEEGKKEAEADDPLKDLLSEEKNKKCAKELGEGVTFVKAEPVTLGTLQGARITYRFDDINKLRISANGGLSNINMNSEMEAPDDAKDDRKHMVFNYKNGVLSIQPKLDEDGEKPADKNEAPKEQTAQEMAMMKQMCTDMKVSMKLVIDSGIAESNATHRDNNTITIMEIDMNKLMENPENMKKLSTLENELTTDALKTISDINGIKVETKPEVTIKLK
jgi:hypothetical protein